MAQRTIFMQINLRKELRSLTLPIFIEMLLVTLMGATDTFMLSQYSDDAVAAVGVANQIVAFAFLIFQITNLGTSVMCSQYIGAGRRDKMEQVTALALVLNLVLGMLISFILSAGARPMLTWMGLDSNLMQYGLPYLQLVGAFAFFQALHLTISASLKADNKPIYPMLVVILVNVVNIVLNYALIFGHWGLPALGVRGAAIASNVCRGVAAVCLFAVLFARHIPLGRLVNSLKTPARELLHETRNLVRIGLPSAGENMSYDAQQMVLTYFITTLGTDALTTRMYAVNIILFVYIFCICVSHASAIVIGHLVGDEKYHAAYKLGWFALKMAVVTTMCFSVCLALGGRWVFGLLTENPEIIKLGCTVLIVDIFLEMGRVSNIFYTNALRAAGDVNFPFWVGISMQWGIGVLFGWLFGIVLGWGLVGMWWAFVLDESVRGVIFVCRWMGKRWMHRSFVQ